MTYIPMDVAVQVAKLVTVAILALVAIAVIDYRSNQKKPPALKGRRDD